MYEAVAKLIEQAGIVGLRDRWSGKFLSIRR